MVHVDRIGLIVLAWLTALGLALAIAGAAHADAPSLADRIEAVVPSLASKREEAVDARELAEAVVAIPKVNADWAALVLTVGSHESALSARIARGDCLQHECDGGRAWGSYQQHANLHNADVWGSPDLRVQTLEAARALRRAFYQCNRGGGGRPVRADWVARTLSAYAGRGCEPVWTGLAPRVATFKRVRAKL